VLGRGWRRWAPTDGEIDAGGIDEPSGGDPAVISRVIQGGRNRESII
jgi:hypothetical protein